jgi:Bacterial Ig-like domain (group 3)
MGGSSMRSSRSGRDDVHVSRFAALSLVVLALSVLMLGLELCAVQSAAAATSFQWTGTGAQSNPNWSSAGNWASDTAPAPSSTVEALDFPPVSGSACEQSGFCLSHNDLTGLTVESMQIDDATDYGIYGEEITLGSGGLTAAASTVTSEPTLAELELPIALSAAQNWSIGGKDEAPINDLLVDGGVNGSPTDALSVGISGLGEIDFASDNEVGPFEAHGTEPSLPGILNGVLGLYGGGLNASDGEPVTLKNLFFYGAGSVGALSTEDAEMYLAIGGAPDAPEGILEAVSATFDSASHISFEIAGSGTTPGSDYSQLLVHGSTQLAGANLVVHRTESCIPLPPGRTYTLVSASGSLSGSFGNAAEGAEIPLKFGSKCSNVSQLLRLAYARGGATQTVTATVVAGPTSTTRLSSSSQVPLTNQAVTLTATVEAQQGTPSGTVEFRDGGTPIGGCASQPLSAGSAACRTAFAAGASPASLTASFTPAANLNLRGSESEPEELTIGLDGSSTTLQATNTNPSLGASETYTATVRALDNGPSSPTGFIEFRDGGAPIAACSHQSLSGGQLASASCQLSYPAAAAHSITAVYGGDSNFVGSSSATAQIVAVAPAGGGSGESPPAQQVAGSTSEAGGIVLLGSSLTAPVGGATATVKLHCTAPRGCRGKLGLTATLTTKTGRGKHGVRGPTTIASGSFAIAAGKTASVKIKLSPVARALLRSGRGRLSAHLTLVEVASGNQQTLSQLVRIVEQTARKSARKHH